MNRKLATELLRRALDNPAAEFREGQLEAIETLLERKRVLVVQRTGWGKSIVYFLATKLLRLQGAGPTIIISPLLALMRNQIAAAAAIGIRADTVNSSNTDDWEGVYTRFTADEIDALLVSPERLGNDDFVQRFLLPVAERLGLVVIDEAHCISDWGHDFRPDYRRLVRILRLLPPNVPVLGTTATANSRVIEDVMAQLGDDVEIRRGALMRESLRLHAEVLPSEAARLAWIAAAVRSIDGSGIVYCLTQRDTERVAGWLQTRGVDAVPYHADVASDIRREREQKLLDNELRVLVATTALGMGFDKPDLAFVIHFQCPTSVVHYYQQVGRAGRSIDQAYGLLLTGEEDRRIAEFFIRNAFPPEERVDQILAALEESEEGLRAPDIERSVNARRGEIEAALKLLSVEERAPVAYENKRWLRTIHPFQLDHDKIEFLADRRRVELDQIHAYARSSTCLMQYLAEALDDPMAQRCGQCSPCLGRPVLEVTIDPGEGRAAEEFLRRTDLPIQPRRRWEGDALECYGWRGNIREPLRVEPGRALCRWGDMFWAALVKQGKESGHFDETLVDEAAILIRDRWRPAPFPTWITCVPSLRTGALVPSFADRLAGRLGLPFSACIRKVRDTAPQKTMENSFHQAGNLAGAFELDVQAAHSGPALLVDDIVDSRWTFTVVGALVRERVGCLVYPFALGSSTNF